MAFWEKVDFHIINTLNTRDSTVVVKMEYVRLYSFGFAVINTVNSFGFVVIRFSVYSGFIQEMLS